MDYINPFSGMGGDATIESPFLRSMDRGTRHNLAAPFIEMAQQNQQMDMQKKQLEHSEFASPLAQQLRQQKMQTGLVEQQQRARALPWTTDAEISDAESKIRSNPAMTEQRIAEAEQLVIKARGTPAQKLFEEIGTLNAGLKQLPESARPMAAQKAIEQFQARYPGAQLPAIMREYNPLNWDMAEYVAIQTARHRQEMEKERFQQGEMTRREEIQSGDRRYAADKQYDRAVDAAVARNSGTGKPENESQARARIRRTLADRNASPEAKEDAQAELKGYLEAQILKEIDTRYLEISQTREYKDTDPRKVTAKSIRKEVYDRAAQEIKSASTGGAPTPTPRASIEEAAKASWGSYEPSKYVYRVGPNGKLQRAAK